jgi:hypothetical protein
MSLNLVDPADHPRITEDGQFIYDSQPVEVFPLMNGDPEIPLPVFIERLRTRHEIVPLLYRAPFLGSYQPVADDDTLIYIIIEEYDSTASTMSQIREKPIVLINIAQMLIHFRDQINIFIQHYPLESLLVYSDLSVKFSSVPLGVPEATRWVEFEGSDYHYIINSDDKIKFLFSLIHHNYLLSREWQPFLELFTRNNVARTDFLEFFIIEVNARYFVRE